MEIFSDAPMYGGEGEVKAGLTGSGVVIKNSNDNAHMTLTKTGVVINK